MDTSATSLVSRVLLTGPPGIGKTTVCKNVASILEKQNRNFNGFYTEEVRAENGSRIGFDIVPIKDGKDKRVPLARIESILSQAQFSKYRVGNYHVFVDNFESSVMPILKTETEILLIDEIGKMELYSKKFHDEIIDIFFGLPKKIYIVATIPQMHKVPQRFLPLFQKLYKDNKCKIINVNRQNRNSLPNEIVSMIP